MANLTTCSNGRGLWQCDAGADALMVKVDDNAPLALVAGALPAREALSLLTETAKLTVPPFYKPAKMWLQDQCSVVGMRDATFKGGTQFDLQCTRGTLSITRDCWKNRCRFFITSGTDPG